MVGGCRTRGRLTCFLELDPTSTATKGLIMTKEVCLNTLQHIFLVSATYFTVDLLRYRLMCFTITVRRTSNGLVQERPLPARFVSDNQAPSINTSQGADVPANQTSKEPSSAAKDDNCSDSVAGLSLSSVSSSDHDDHGANASVKLTLKPR